MNRQKEAIQCFDQVIALNANYTNAYNNKGNALQSLNKFNEAIKCYNTAIEIDPEYADAYYNKVSNISEKNFV
jgi:tetratricopeptide (TPR) repeat protein